MSDNTEIRKIIGLPELRDKLENPEWLHKPTRNFLAKWASRVQRETVKRFERGPGGWIDTAETRKSVTHEIDSEPFPMFARVGSNRDQFRWGEYGTGLLSEDPESPKTRHWPPGDALEEWAAKRGMTGHQVARIIGIRGGIAPRRMLRDSVEAVEPEIEGFLNEFADDIEAEAQRGVK